MSISPLDDPIKGVILLLLLAAHSIAGLILVPLHVDAILGQHHLLPLGIDELGDVPMVLLFLLRDWSLLLVTLGDARELGAQARGSWGLTFL